MHRAWWVRVMAMSGILLLGAPVAWAVDEPSSEQPSQYPQGPGPAPGPVPGMLDATSYQPIPSSMLPIGAVGQASAVPGQQASLPSTTNLGGIPVPTTMGPYTLGRDDVVFIAVQGQPEFSGQYVLGPNGAIQYGFVGDVPAAGLTKEELAQVIADKLKRYVRVPSVYVTIMAFNSKAIYILGEVGRPGKYAMRGDSIKIREALIAAGLLTEGAAINRVHVIKADPSDPTYRVVNVRTVLYRGAMKDNIDLVDGDIVLVPSTVWGTVNNFIGALLDPARKARSVTALGALAL